MKRFSLMTMILVAVALSGCAGNQNMEARVAELETRNQQQEHQIVQLKQKLGEKEAADKDQSWDWTNVWNNDTVQDLKVRLQKCWSDLKTSQK